MARSMLSHEIRQSFISFFADRDHTIRRSASLIPIEPTLLLTNAGMVPFLPFFRGEESPPFPRAVTIQKVARTVDIDLIGTTARHLTFFEMLGNFSFGDYFKEKAIPWAFEYVTESLGLDPDRLWFTVHNSDDEAAEIWIDSVGVPPDRVQRRGNDNFWQMGVPGPSGPSSEVFFDRGPAWGQDGGPEVDEERFTEIWNLVFMQNIQDEPYHVIGDLPAKNIDTGAGLERVAMVMQDVENVFEIDLIRPVVAAAENYTGVTYRGAESSDVSLKILADHARSVTMLIADGVMPSNEGRGHVLRRLLRRAVRHAWQLGGEGLVMPHLVAETVKTLQSAHPDLAGREAFIIDLVEREESRFRRTLESGYDLLEGELLGVEADFQLAGEVAFRLHDTYGFPIELTTEIAGEKGLEVDTAGFEKEMESQRARARAAWKGGEGSATADAYRRLVEDIGPTQFLGYETPAVQGRVLAILVDGEQVDRAIEGQELELFLDRTSFYAEAGGQVGDTGMIETETGTMAISDTQAAVLGLHGHRATVSSGSIHVGQDADIRIDAPRRERIAKSHTGTHILHSALRSVIGDHVHQAGSLVEPGRLRFDFSHFSGLEDDELSEVERQANLWVIDNNDVSTVETTKDEAEAMGALAFFGDKYGEQVRVVEIGDFSLEFCGGTHTPTSGQVGPVIVLSESSIGANTRRVEALTGADAYRFLSGARARLVDAGRLLRVPPDEVPDRLEQLQGRLAILETELGTIADQRRKERADQLSAGAREVAGSSLIVSRQPESSPDELRRLAVEVRDRVKTGVVILGATSEGKGALVATVTADLVGREVSAGDMIAEAAKSLGGGGSRDADLAQAGGPLGEALDHALSIAQEAGEKRLAEV